MIYNGEVRSLDTGVCEFPLHLLDVRLRAYGGAKEYARSDGLRAFQTEAHNLDGIFTYHKLMFPSLSLCFVNETLQEEHETVAVQFRLPKG